MTDLPRPFIPADHPELEAEARKLDPQAWEPVSAANPQYLSLVRIMARRKDDARVKAWSAQQAQA